MKKTILLTIVLLVSLIALAAPVAADDSGFTNEPIPSSFNNQLEPGVDIVDIAVASNGVTIFAATGDTGNHIYKSEDGGVTWSGLDLPLFGVDLLAIAPDNDNIVVAVERQTNTVMISSNAGTDFSSLPAPSGITGICDIYDVAISATFSGTRYIALAGSDALGGSLSYFNLGPLPSTWRDATKDVGLWDISSLAASTAIKAVAFSPNFAFDQIMTVVSVNSAGDVQLQAASYSFMSWNTSINGYAGYPITLYTAVTSLEKASIAFHEDYLGSDQTSRRVFIGTALTGGGDAPGSLLRLDDTIKTIMQFGAAIQSVAFNGTNLVAGANNTNYVYYSENPLETEPEVKVARPYKRPGGETKVVVAYAGANVVAGTSGDESAFSVSMDNVMSFNDISLIDTKLATLEDVAVSRDGTKIYLLSDDGDDQDLSLWRYDGVWERVFSLQGNKDYIVRIAPENSEVVYLSESGTNNMFYSYNSGETWFMRLCIITPVDITVESADVLYAVNSGGFVSKSINNGFFWDNPPKDTGLGSGSTITSISEDNLIVGSADGYVAYSTDGNSTWIKIGIPLSNELVHVTADGLSTGNYIFAVIRAYGDYIYRYEIASNEAKWSKISPTFGAQFMCSGLILNNGVLYVSGYNIKASISTIYRTLTPSEPEPNGIKWRKFNTTIGVEFTNSPNAMVFNDQGDSRIWAIDSYADSYHLYSYRLD